MGGLVAGGTSRVLLDAYSRGSHETRYLWLVPRDSTKGCPASRGELQSDAALARPGIAAGAQSGTPLPGARRGELLNMRWSDINWAKGDVTIFGTRGFANGRVQEGMTKGGRARVVSLELGHARGTERPPAASSRREARCRMPVVGGSTTTSSYLFTTERGQPIHPDTPPS